MWRTNKLNNIPLSEEEVKNRFNKYGMKIVDYTYKNNSTRMLCVDSEGYLVKANLDILIIKILNSIMKKEFIMMK